MARDYYDESKKKKKKKETTQQKAKSPSVSKNIAKTAQKAANTAVDTARTAAQNVSRQTGNKSYSVSKQRTKDTATRVVQRTASSAQRAAQRMEKRSQGENRSVQAVQPTYATAQEMQQARQAERFGEPRSTNNNQAQKNKVDRIVQDQKRREDRRTTAQAIKGGTHKTEKTAASKWDNDIAETITHTLKQTAASDKAFVNSALHGITMKGRDTMFTSEQNKKADEKFEKRREKYSAEVEKETQALEDLKKGHSYLGKQALSALSSTTGMAADIALGAATGTGQAGTLAHMFARSTGATQGQVRKKASALRAQLEKTGTYEKEELDEMFKNVDAMDELNALASGGIEVVSELLFPGYGMARKAIGGKGMSIAERALGKLLKGSGGKASSGFLKNMLRGTAEEVAEEEIAGPAQAFAANAIYGNKFQEYNEDAVRRSLKAQSDDLRSRIASEDDARQVAARLSSSSFLNDSKQAYLDSGLTEEQASRLAELSRDYLSASLSGDIDKAKETQDEMVSLLAGGEESLREKFTLRDALDAAVSTSMMTMGTGALGAISSANVGRAFKGTAGINAVRQQAEIIRNWGDSTESSKAQAVMDRIDAGEDISDTQVYELIQGAAEAAEQGYKDEETSRGTAAREMKKRDLRISPIQQDGTLAPQTAMRYDNIVSQTVSRYSSLAKLGQVTDMDAADIALGADIGAAMETGVITAEQINELAKGSATVKAVFSDVTGINLDQFSVNDRSGNLDISETNKNMRQALMAEAAHNMVNSARVEQAAWTSETRGAISESIARSVSRNSEIKKGYAATVEALQTVDPRDRDQFMLMGSAAENIYEYAYNTQDTWDDVKGTFKKMYPSLDMSALKGIYDSAKMDKIEAETPFLNAKVKAGEALDSLAKGKAKAVVRGKFENTTPLTETGKGIVGRDLTDDELLVCTSLAEAFNANITMIDAQDERLSYTTPDGKKGFSNAYVDLKNGEIFIGNAADIGKIVHEVTHMGARLASDKYLDMAHYIMDKAYKFAPERTKAMVEAYKRTYAGQNLTDAQIEEELVSDLVAVFSDDPIFIREISQEQPSLAKRIYNAILDVLHSLRNILATGRIQDPAVQESFLEEIGAYEQARQLWLTMMREASRNNAAIGLAEWEDKAFRDTREQENEYENGRFSLVTDPETIAELEADDHVTTYRGMVKIDGKYYSPMSTRVADENGKYQLREGIVPGQWVKADITTDSRMFTKDGLFKLKKDDPKLTDVGAAYNPYMHSSTSMMNDQFETQYKRPNLVVIEGVVPKSELESGYRAEHDIDDGRHVVAKDTTGKAEWKPGPVERQIPTERQRTVYLSNHFKMVREVPAEEVAQHIHDKLEGTGVAMTYNSVTPDVRKELLKLGTAMKQNKQNKYKVNLDEEDLSLIEQNPNASRYSLDVEDGFYIKDGNARWTDERIDYIIRDNSERFTNKTHAWAAMISPRDFLKLTLDDKYLDKWNESAQNVPEEIQGMSYAEADEYVYQKFRETGEWIHDNENYPLDENELRSERTTPFLKILQIGNSVNVDGHEGRHRMRALWEAGISSVPVLITTNGLNAKSNISNLTLRSQEYGFPGPVNNGATVTLNDLVPVTEDHREELTQKFGGDAQVRFSITPEDIDALDDAGLDVTESGTVVRYSLESWMNTDIEALKEKLRNAGYGEERIDEWVNDINSISALILGDMQRLNYAADQFQDALKPNAEYYYTLDLSTLCQKRRLYQGTYNKIMHYLVNRVLMPEDTVRLRAMMDEMGYQVPCGICYEESRKKNEGKFAERWLNGYGKRWKGYKNTEHEDPYIPTLNEVTTTDGREKLRAEHPEAYESYVNYQKTRGSANPKISYTHTDYRGDILRMSDNDIQKVKHIGGLRIQSFSDFEIPHVIDMMQAVMDMSAQKLTAQAYTKVPAFAEIFGGTGIKINLSLIGRYNSETEQLEFDAKEGIDPEQAFKLRDKYSQNVGTILVGSDDTSILKAWADPRVDMVIPFHRSGWSKKEFEKLGLVGYKDYTKGQTERYMMGKKDMALSTASKALGLTKDQKLQPIYSADYWDNNLSGTENAKRYLELCAEKHYRPVFYQFLHDNGDGTWSLQEDGSTDGYWKSLIDFKMYDNDGNFAPQELVQPTFDMEAAQRFMDEYEGGADTLPVADDVVKEFLAEYKQNHPNAKINIDDDVRLSISVDFDDSYMDAINSGNMEEAQRLVDEAAKMAGYDTPKLHHGTHSFGFTTFDLGKGENIIFATNSRLTAETYSGETDRDSIGDIPDINVDDLYGENLLDAAKRYMSRYSDYRLMPGWEKENLLEEDRAEAAAIAQDIRNFISENQDAFNDEKLEMANRMADAIDRMSRAWNDDDVQNAYEEYWDADYDLMWTDESIQKEIHSLMGTSAVETLRKRMSDMMYAGDLYARGESTYQYVFDNQLALELDAEIHRGIYGLYGKSDNQLVIEANGSNWNQIVPPDELELYGPQRTRSIAEAAKAKGYDSVLFKDLRDNGGATAYNGESDVYMFFNPSQVKSADPVTYADDGSVIPLSERFDPTNNDIRYSLPTQDTDGNILSDGQMEYFKNSQARDSRGRLVPVYHTTNRGGFTIFDPARTEDKRSLFFTDDFAVSQTYGRYASKPIKLDEPEEEKQRGYYAVYLNLTNPLIVDAKGSRWKGISYEGRIVSTNDLSKIAQDEGYDGLIVRNCKDIGGESKLQSGSGYSDIYVAFSSNQVKDMRNENPSENPDIRYSKTDPDEAMSRMAHDYAYDTSHEALEYYESIIDDLSDSDTETVFNKVRKLKDVEKFYDGLQWYADGMVFDDPVLEEGRERMASSRADFFSRNNARWNATWLTEGRVLDDKSVRKPIRELVMSIMQNADTPAKYKTDVVNKTIVDVRLAYNYARQGRTEIADALLWHSSLRMIENVDFIDDEVFNNYKDLRDYLRTTRISLGEEYWADVNYQQFRKDNYNKINLVRGETNVDTIYQEMCELWPEFFKEDEYQTPPEQLARIEQVLDSIKPYRMAYSSEEAAEMAFDIASELFDIMESGTELKSFADKAKERTAEAVAAERARAEERAAVKQEKFDHDVKALKARHMEAMREAKEKVRQAEKEKAKAKFKEYEEELRDVKEQHREEIRQLKAKNRQDLKAAKKKADFEIAALKQNREYNIQRLKAEKARAVAEEKQKSRWKDAERRENTYHNKYFKSIKKSYDTLVERLRTNTKDKHIPEQYKRELAAMLSAFDFQTVRSKKLQTKEGPDGYERVDMSMKTINMLVLQSELKKIAADTPLFRVNDAVTDLISELTGMYDGSYREEMNVDGKTLDELNSEQLKKIDKLLKALIHEFNNYENVRIGKKKQKAADIGGAQIESSLAHAEKYGPGSDYFNFPGRLDKLLNMDELTPAYLFRQIDPSGNGLGTMFRELRRSFDKYVRNQAQLSEWMDEIVGEYHEKGKIRKYGSGELEHWRSANYAQTIELESGKSVTLTPAQMMSIHCLARRTQAYNHMVGDGIVVKPVSFQAKLMSDLRKKADYSLPVKLTDTDIQNIEQKLTPEQVIVADKLQQLMATKMAAWGNEASMAVIGIKLFEDPDYFPIKSDKAALEKDFTAEQFTEMIRSFGFAKAVAPNARNAIAIDDIFEIVTEHCNNMNLYNAYSESMNDFMKVYNYKQAGPDSVYSVEQAVAHAYSQKATTFIRTFMADINGNVSRGRDTGIDQMMNDALGKAKKASVFANGRVALQQPTAIVRAFSVIDPKYLKGVNVARTKAAMQEMFERCPIALWKSWGYYDINMGKSIEDLVMNNGSVVEDLMSDIYGKLDNKTWSVIWQMVKNEVRETNPELKENTDEFFDKCNERMSEVVDLTQVVDSPFHRSHAMRDKNTLTKMFTAFMAEPTLTYNMVRDGIMRAVEARRDGNKTEFAKILGKTTAVFVAQAAAVSAAAAIWDAIRRKKPDKDDEDDSFFNLWWMNCIENFKDNINLFNDIYYAKDVMSIFEGWDQKNLGLQGFVHLRDAYNQLTGNKKVSSKLSWLENALAGIGYLSGVPAKTLINDTNALWEWLGWKPGVVEFAETWAENTQQSLQDMLGGEAAAMGITQQPKVGSNNEQKPAAESAPATSAKGWTYENAPFHVEDGSLVDKVLNHFGVNLTASEINAIEDKEKEAERQKKINDILEKTESLSGEEKDKKVWKYVTTYMKAENEDIPLSEVIQKGDYGKVGEYRAMYTAAGGDPEYFTQRIYDTSKTALKKSISADNTPAQIEQQQRIKDYLLRNGMEEAEMSEIAYKSYTARDLKAAIMLNDADAAVTELRALLQAGMTDEDFYRLWDNRKKFNIMNYKKNGKYKDRFKSTGTYKWSINGTITSTFGGRKSPGGIGSTDHKGIDIAGSTGDPVYASDGGVVIMSKYYGGYGKTVQIQHDDGTITQYSHLSWWDAQVGDVVGQGQVIGKVGSTGNSTGPHLHFGIIKDGRYVDPMKYLQ